MRGKVAKRLRSQAYMMSVGRPERTYGYKLVGKKSPSGTIVLGTCTRSLYKYLKKLYKSGAETIERPKTTTQRVQEPVQN